MPFSSIFFLPFTTKKPLSNGGKTSGNKNCFHEKAAGAMHVRRFAQNNLFFQQIAYFFQKTRIGRLLLFL